MTAIEDLRKTPNRLWKHDCGYDDIPVPPSLVQRAILELADRIEKLETPIRVDPRAVRTEVMDVPNRLSKPIVSKDESRRMPARSHGWVNLYRYLDIDRLREGRVSDAAELGGGVFSDKSSADNHAANFKLASGLDPIVCACIFFSKGPDVDLETKI